MSSSLAIDHACPHDLPSDDLPSVDETTVDDALAASAAVGRTVVLFFRGEAGRWPEADDIAVILPQLIKAFPGRLTAAVVSGASERALMARFGVTVCPSLALARPDRTLGVIAKIQDWSSYVARIGALLAEDAPVCTAEAQS